MTSASSSSDYTSVSAANSDGLGNAGPTPVRMAARKSLFAKQEEPDLDQSAPASIVASRAPRDERIPVESGSTQGVDLEVLKKATAILDSLYGKVVQNWAGFIPRDGQIAMMRESLLTFLSSSDPETAPRGGNLAELEAGTGTGKTIAYCLAAIAASQVTGKKVLISTATIALQEQLVKRDLPRLAEILGGLKFDILKGRGRYACTSRLENVLADDFSSEWLSDIDANKTPSKPDGSTEAFAKKLLADLNSESWDGDIDSIVVQPLPGQWAKVQADAGSCSANKCKNYSKCAFFKARNKAGQATLVVGNHALVLASLATDSTKLIDPANTLFIFDEAHHIPDIAAAQYANNARLDLTLKIQEKLRATLVKAERKLSPAGKIASALAAVKLTEAAAKVHNIQTALQSSNLLSGEDGTYRFPNGLIPPGLAAEFEAASAAFSAALSSVFTVTGELQQDDESVSQSELNDRKLIASEILTYAGRIVMARDVCEAMVKSDRIPLVKWISRVESSLGMDIQINASPLTPASGLATNLWSKVSAAVCSSATLTACGGFDYFDRLSGLNRFPGRRSGIVASPFDYVKQGELRVAHMDNNPKSNDFAKELSDRLPAILAPHKMGQLVLFTSKKQMEMSFKALPPELAANVMMQGQHSRGQMLKEHGLRVQAGRSSILFGLQSMGEGLDLPGDLCNHVVIDKLPFVPPTSPVEAGLSEWLTSQERDPFEELAVPKTAMRLAQWVGRAIRSVNDYAVITVCDTRLATTGYGREIISGLPPFPLVVMGNGERAKSQAGKQGNAPTVLRRLRVA